MSENRLQGASFPVAAIMLAVAVYLLVGIVQMEVPGTAGTPGPKFFPTIITLSAFVVSALMFVQSSRQLVRDRAFDKAHSTPPEKEDDSSLGAAEMLGRLPKSNWKMVAIVVLSYVIFLLLLQPVGWLISAALLFFGVSKGLGSDNLFNNAVIGLTLSSVIQLVFSGLLGINLPTGILGGL